MSAIGILIIFMTFAFYQVLFWNTQAQPGPDKADHAEVDEVEWAPGRRQVETRTQPNYL